MTRTIVQRERAFQVAYDATPNRCRFSYPVAKKFIDLTFPNNESNTIHLNCIRGKFERIGKRWYYITDVKVSHQKQFDTFLKVQDYVRMDFYRIMATMNIFKMISNKGWDKTHFLSVYHKDLRANQNQ